MTRSLQDAWLGYLKAVADCSWVLDHPDTPKDPATLASGVTNLHRLAQLSWEIAFEYRNFDAPMFFPVSVRNLSHGWNSSNANYWIAAIDGGRAYRMTGDRGHAPFMEIGLYDNIDGFAEPGGGGGRLLAAVTERELDAGSGTIELRLGPDVDGPGSLATAPGPKYVFVRQYAYDWTATPPSSGLFLQPTDRASAGQTYESRLLHGLKEAPRHLANHVALYHALAVKGLSEWKNSLFAIPPDMSATLPSAHRFACAYFDLRDDQALLIEFVPEDAPYWSLELGDFWGQTLDYDRTLDADTGRPYDRPAARSHLNDREIVRETDGSVRIYVSAEPPPRPSSNWLDTRRYKVGIIVYRQLRRLDRLPQFKASIVSRGDAEQ